jgi:hypothetical protein
MTNTLLWTAFYLLIAMVLVATVVRGIGRLLQRRRDSGGPRRQSHDH